MEQDGAEAHGSPTARTRNLVLLENPPHQRCPGQPRWLWPQRGLLGEPYAEVSRRGVHWRHGYDLATPGVVGCEDAVVEALVLSRGRDESDDALQQGVVAALGLSSDLLLVGSSLRDDHHRFRLPKTGHPVEDVDRDGCLVDTDGAGVGRDSGCVQVNRRLVAGDGAGDAGGGAIGAGSGDGCGNGGGNTGPPEAVLLL